MPVPKVIILVLIVLHCIFAIAAGVQVVRAAKSYNAMAKVMGFFLAGLGVACGFAGYRFFLEDFQMAFIVMAVASGLLLFFGGPIPSIMGFCLAGGMKWYETKA